MKKFILFIRGDYNNSGMDSETGKRVMDAWSAWYKKIGEAGALVDPGNPIATEGKIVHAGSVQDKIVVHEGKCTGSYLIVQAADIDGAVKIAGECPGIADPSLGDPTSEIEIRELYEMPI